MTAPAVLNPLLELFVNCFTSPGYRHFVHFVTAHASLWSGAHCVTETLRQTGWHRIKHWTTPYLFLRCGYWSCRAVSQRLLEVLRPRLAVGPEEILAIDDTLVKKWGRGFFGLGYYPDPTDKNPGASRRRVLGHCWVALGLLWEQRPGSWFCFPLNTLLFVPRMLCGRGFEFQTKIELAVRLLQRLRWSRRVILLVDNLYAKARLITEGLRDGDVLVSRLKSNAALYELPPKPRTGRRGRPQKRGLQVSARQLYCRRSQRRKLTVHIYGKRVTFDVFVGTLISSRTLGSRPIQVVICPQRSGQRMNVFFTTDLTMSPQRLLELYGARFKIEDAFDELKTSGGFADCRQRSFTALKRHATLCLVTYSLLRLLSLTLKGAQHLAAEPWWHPPGPPSATRLRRALNTQLAISCSSHSRTKINKILPAQSKRPRKRHTYYAQAA